MDNRRTWDEDLLGPGFACRTIPLAPDEEGEVVTTIVTHVPGADPLMPEFCRRRGRDLPASDPSFVFLAIHGWNDYFYQVELARAVSAMGGAFYAVDLRKYGRSLRSHQTFGFIRNLDFYDEELHACADIIYAEHEAKLPVVVYGHSTGGLIAALWADRHPGAIAGLVLNAPWIVYQGSTLARQIGTPVVDILARFSPASVIPTASNDFYQRSITAWHPPEGQSSTGQDPAGSDPKGHDSRDQDPSDPFWAGGWNPDPAFRSGTGAPVRPGWLSAILAGQARIASGLAIDCPILVLTSARSITSDTWSEDFRAADSVLDVGKIWRRVPSLGCHVTLVKLRDAVHDVTLSRRPVRERAFEEMETFVASYVLR